MGDSFKIFPFTIPPRRLTAADKREFIDAELVVDLWEEKLTQYFKNPTEKKKKPITCDTHNLRIKSLLINTTRAAHKTLLEAQEKGVWPVQRPPSPTPARARVQKVEQVKQAPIPQIVRAPVAIDPIPGYSGSHMPVKREENDNDREKRMARRKAEMEEYERRMAEREAQEDREEKERERAREAHRMSEIRAEQMKTIVMAQSRLLRPDKYGIKLKWERTAVKC